MPPERVVRIVAVEPSNEMRRALPPVVPPVTFTQETTTCLRRAATDDATGEPELDAEGNTVTEDYERRATETNRTSEDWQRDASGNPLPAPEPEVARYRMYVEALIFDADASDDAEGEPVRVLIDGRPEDSDDVLAERVLTALEVPLSAARIVRGA